MMPLIVETLLLCAVAYGLGLGAGRLIFGRRERRSFAD